MPNFINYGLADTKVSNEFQNFCHSFGLSQLNNIVNCSGRLLDLVLSDSKAIDVSSCPSPLVPEDKYHPVLVLSIKFVKNDVKSATSVSCNKYDFSKANFLQLYTEMSNLNFSSIYAETDVNVALNMFYNNVYQAMDIAVPKKNNTFNPKFPIWYTKKIIFKIKKKNRLCKRKKN